MTRKDEKRPMADHSRVLENISNCDDPDKLRTWIGNARQRGAPDVAEAAFRRLIDIVPEEEAPGSVEHDFWRMINAFEFRLLEERGKTVRLTRTRQKVKRSGVHKTLADWAQNPDATDGFRMLMERDMPELTGEAIILRHAETFESEIVQKARARLEAAGVDTAALPA